LLLVLVEHRLLLVEAQIVLLLVRVDENASVHQHFVCRHEASLNVACDLQVVSRKRDPVGEQARRALVRPLDIHTKAWNQRRHIDLDHSHP
jgi:hypothetical protein